MSNYFNLESKVAVVTGGTSGIGLEVARRFRGGGAHVVIAGRRDGTAIAEEIGATFCKTDVSNEESVAALMEVAEDTYGPIDAVVNCAGVNRGYETLMDGVFELGEERRKIGACGKAWASTFHAHHAYPLVLAELSAHLDQRDQQLR